MEIRLVDRKLVLVDHHKLTVPKDAKVIGFTDDIVVFTPAKYIYAAKRVTNETIVQMMDPSIWS